MSEPDEVLNFWFYDVGRERWFVEDPSLDQRIRENFAAAYQEAVDGKLKNWQDTPQGVLALLLLLDQFPRRMFRGTSRAYQTDDIALELARDAIIKHYDDRIDKQYKLLFYLPFLNSEDMGDQRLALFYIRERTKDSDWLTYAERNHEIVQRFGRFPQRNPVLGREPTPEEHAFLAHPQNAAFA